MIEREDGTSVVELMVTMLVSSVVLVAIGTALVSATKGERAAEEESVSLGVLRSTLAQLTHEIREGRRVYDDSTATRLRLWVDSDRDNQQDLVERITWELQTAGGGARLVRSTAAGDSRVVSGELVMTGVFAYGPASPGSGDVSYVRVTLSADGDPDRAPPPRRVDTDVRLRNATRG